jgi:hypothetical protein
MYLNLTCDIPIQLKAHVGFKEHSNSRDGSKRVDSVRLDRLSFIRAKRFYETSRRREELARSHEMTIVFLEQSPSRGLAPGLRKQSTYFDSIAEV